MSHFHKIQSIELNIQITLYGANSV